MKTPASRGDKGNENGARWSRRNLRTRLDPVAHLPYVVVTVWLTAPVAMVAAVRWARVLIGAPIILMAAGLVLGGAWVVYWLRADRPRKFALDALTFWWLIWFFVSSTSGLRAALGDLALERVGVKLPCVLAADVGVALVLLLARLVSTRTARA